MTLALNSRAVTPRSLGTMAPMVCTVDERYVVPLLALLESIAAVHGRAVSELRMILVHRGLHERSRHRIQRRAERLGIDAQFRQAPASRTSYPVSGWVSDAVYLRLSLPEIVGDERHVLYLDTDTLILRDLRPLLRMRLDGKAIGAVRDPQNPTIGEGAALLGCRQIAVAPGRAYFNSGVMLLDLEQAVRQGLFQRAHEFLTRHPDHARFWDQDALNVAANDDWVRLDRCWNTFAFSALTQLPNFSHRSGSRVTPLADLLADEYTAAILHFAGPAKPWQPDYPEVPVRRLYQRYLATEGRARP